jgi:hypothetical protein
MCCRNASVVEQGNSTQSMTYPYCTINAMSHIHAMCIDQIFLSYRNYPNKILFCEAVCDITYMRVINSYIISIAQLDEFPPQ